MDENNQGKAGSKLVATEDKLWLPPLSPKDQKKVDQLRKKQNGQKKVGNKWRWGFSDKTGWEWLQLLIQLLAALALPVVLFLATQWFSTQQSQTNLQIANDQQQEATLQAYLEHMSDLLLNHGLRRAKPGDEVSQMARERTLTILRRLEATRNKIVLQFLQDAHLIGVKNAVIDLSNADLSGDDLIGVNLSFVNLRGADLRVAHLGGANLGNADLSCITPAVEEGCAELFGADLRGADLRGADLSGADLSGADLYGANLPGATLSGADLTFANLPGADLSGADLSGADLYGANLSCIRISLGIPGRVCTNLSGANLTKADLKGATGITDKELEKEAKSLQGATMPDGSKHP